MVESDAVNPFRRRVRVAFGRVLKLPLTREVEKRRIAFQQRPTKARRRSSGWFLLTHLRGELASS